MNNPMEAGPSDRPCLNFGFEIQDRSFSSFSISRLQSQELRIWRQPSSIDHHGRAPYIRASMKRLFLIATFGVALVILIVVFTQIDVAAAFTQIQHVGFAGAAAILAEMTVALLGPLLAWHILMRADGIRIRFGTTLISGLMGRAVNLVSPLMYFGGEGVRTIHIARVTKMPSRRVLGTIVGSEFQLLTALSACIGGALMIIAAGGIAHGLPLSWMLLGTLSLAILAGLILSALLLDLHVLARSITLLIRIGIFPKRLESVREAAADMEETVRGLLIRHKASFLAAQLLVFVSPLASFVQPAIFFWFLRSAGGNGPQPGMTQLASFFVLVELLFMLPTTPAGLGIYEGGIIGIFRLHGWSVPDGAAYAILMRLDDVLFSIAGALLLARFGLRESKGKL
jgi:uncharacterized protein (TIRG00374 family)